MVVEYYDCVKGKTRVLEIENCDYSVEQLQDIFGTNYIEYCYWGIRFIDDDPITGTIWYVDLNNDGSIEMFHKENGADCEKVADEEYDSIEHYLRAYGN